MLLKHLRTLNYLHMFNILENSIEVFPSEALALKEVQPVVRGTVALAEEW